MMIIFAGCDAASAKTYEFSELKNAIVNITTQGEIIDIVCIFQMQKSFSKANNIIDDKKNASVLAKKALCRYLDVKWNEQLLIKGMESDKPVYFDNKVKIRFFINKNNCEKVKATKIKEDMGNEQ